MLAAKYAKYTSVDSVDQNWWIHIRRIEHSAHLSPASQPRHKVRPMVVDEMSPAHLRPGDAAEKLAAAVEHVGTCWNTQKVDLLRIY